MMTLAKGEPDAFLVKSYQIKSSQITRKGKLCQSGMSQLQTALLGSVHPTVTYRLCMHACMGGCKSRQDGHGRILVDSPIKDS